MKAVAILLFGIATGACAILVPGFLAPGPAARSGAEDGERAGVERIDTRDLSRAVTPPVSTREIGVVASEILSLERQAAADPRRALLAAIEIGDPVTRRWAIERVGAVWARTDPLAAFDHADLIPDELREAWRRTVIHEWAYRDVDGAMSFLERVDPRLVPNGLWRPYFTANNRERLLDLALRLPPRQRQHLASAALRGLFERDPNATLVRIANLPLGSNRDQTLEELARAFGRRDPVDALDWAARLSPPSPRLLRTVLQEAAARDFNRAMELVLTLPASDSEISNAALAVIAGLGNDFRDAAALADRLVDERTIHATSMLARLLERWSEVARQDALDWIAANATNVDLWSVRGIAARVAERDLELAERHADRLPETIRAAWLEAVVRQHVSRDPNAAGAWVLKLREDPASARLVQSLLDALAREDPAAAARLLEDVDADVRQQRVSLVASSWAERDPAEAARWAEGLADRELHSSAIQSVALVWARRDAAQAQRWLLGQLRDERETGILPSFFANSFAYRNHELDRELFAALRTDVARANALRLVLYPLVRNDEVDRARRMIETYVRDAQLRASLERDLQRAIERRGAPGL